MAGEASTRANVIRWVLLAVLVAVNVGVFSYAQNQVDDRVQPAQPAVADPARAPSPSPSPEVTVVGAEDGPRALVITGNSSVVPRAARRLPWRAEVVVTPTSSFTNTAGTAPGDLFQVVRAREDLEEYRHIVIQGGDDNEGTDQGTLTTALLHLLDEVSAKVGSGATITLMGPLPATEAEVTDVDRALREAVEARGIVYIDPAARDWTLADADLVSAVTQALATAARLEPAGGAPPTPED